MRQNQALNIFSDRPVQSSSEDSFDFVAYADTFALLINDPGTATPLTVAVSGPWGSGKTSLARLVEERLAVEEYWRLSWSKPPITCWFNAWLHRDAPHLGVALAAAVTRTIGAQRPWYWRLVRPLPVALASSQQRWRRTAWRTVIALLLLLVVLFALLAFVPSVAGRDGSLGFLYDDWRKTIAWWAAIPFAAGLVRASFRATDHLGAYFRSPDATAALGGLTQVQEELSRILRQAQGEKSRRIVIFVDDLERCAPDKALDVCEVATQLLAQPGVVTFLIADVDLIELAAQSRYQPERLDLETQAGSSIGQQYLHKLIHLRFNLPPLGRESVAAALRALPRPSRRGTRRERRGGRR